MLRTSNLHTRPNLTGLNEAHQGQPIMPYVKTFSNVLKRGSPHVSFINTAKEVVDCLEVTCKKTQITFFEWSPPLHAILTWFVTYHLEVCIRSIFWHSLWHLFWHSIWHSIWPSLWHSLLAASSGDISSGGELAQKWAREKSRRGRRSCTFVKI